jgi:hypothetical protein
VFFPRVDDFDAAFARMAADDVAFATTPRTEPYGRVAVFPLDIAGNRWDLLGPHETVRAPGCSAGRLGSRHDP